jgi:Sel1 repeat
MNPPIRRSEISDRASEFPTWPDDRVRSIVGHSAALPVEEPTPRPPLANVRRSLSDDRELMEALRRLTVAPKQANSSLWVIAVQMCLACAVAAAAAWFMVSFLTRQTSNATPQTESSIPSNSPNPLKLAQVKSPAAETEPIHDSATMTNRPLIAAPARAAATADLSSPPEKARSLINDTPPAAQTVPPAAPKLPQVEATVPIAGNPPVPPTPATGLAITPPLAPPPQQQPKIMVLDPDEIAGLIARGKDFLMNGDLVSARQLLKRAAEAGSAEAALALGATFDPFVIKQLGAIGIEPDIDRARDWYQKAAALGSAAASRQLANLPRAR